MNRNRFMWVTVFCVLLQGQSFCSTFTIINNTTAEITPLLRRDGVSWWTPVGSINPGESFITPASTQLDGHVATCVDNNHESTVAAPATGHSIPVGGGGNYEFKFGGSSAPPPTSSIRDSNDGVPRSGATAKSPPCGMPQWEVSEPYISLWLHDEPLGYQPALGPRVSCTLSYKQREFKAGLSPTCFGVGKQWNFSWLSYVDTNGLTPVVNFPNGGNRNFYINFGSKDSLSSADLTGDLSVGYTLAYPDGRTNIYGFRVWNGNSLVGAFLTEQRDAQGHSTRLIYDAVDSAAPVVRLRYVIDGNGRTNTISYVTSNAYSTNLISQVTDAFGRTCSFAYDTNGYLTNITDVAEISSSFTYEDGTLTAMTTPYGTTVFSSTEASNPAVSQSGRSMLVSEPDGSRQLYLYRDNAPGVTNSYPGYLTNGAYFYPDYPWNTSPFGNGFGNSALDIRNTFHWGRGQYAALSTTNVASLQASDFRKARRQHWRFNEASVPAELVFLECAPSSDLNGSVEGQKTWFDYDGYQGQPRNIAQMLPDGTTRFTHFTRNSFGSVTNEVGTYASGGSILLRTNVYVYAANEIDLLAVTNALGVQVFTNSYNAYHQVLTNFNALGEKTVFTYNANQQLVRILWPSGLTTTNVYYTSGLYSNWLAQTIDVEIARTNGFGYTNGLIYTHTNSLGMVTTNTWDNLQRPLTVADARGKVSFTYTNLDLIRVVDRLGFTNSFGYDALQRMTAATNALGFYSLYDFCTCGGLNSIRDPAGNYTHFYRDNLGRATNIIYADDYRVTNTFNSLGQLTRMIDSAGTGVTNWFNNQGLLVTVSNALGRISLATYDVLDRLTNSVDPNGLTLTNTFDNLNRLLTRGYPDGGVEKFGYTLNIAGTTSYTNQLGSNVVNYTYDLAGRKTIEVYPGITTNRFVYSAASDLLQLIDGKNQTNKWNYDLFSRATNKVDAAGNEIFRYAYDPNNRLTNRWTPAKGNTAYGHDALGNVTNIDYATSPDISLQYDSLNQLTNLVDAVGATKLTYNAASQLLSEDGPWADDTVSYGYANRLRTSLNLLQPSAAAWSQTYAYDMAQRMTNVASLAGDFGYGYDTQRQMLLSQVRLPGGSYITNTYDSVARLLITQLKNGTGTVLNSHTYGYNLADQRTALTNSAGDYRNYTYDNGGQLKTAIGKEAGGMTNRVHEQFGYAYDAAGNLNYRTNNALVQTFNVNSRNELSTVARTGTLTVAGNTTSAATNVTVNTLTALRYADLTYARTNLPLVDATTNFTAIAYTAIGLSATNTVTADLRATTTFVYDLNGNLRTNGMRIYEYDDENQLVTNWVATTWKTEFVYDGQGRKRIQRDYNWTNSAWSKTNESRYVYDGMLAIQKRDSSNYPLVTYTRGLDLSGTMQGAGGIGGLLARTDNSPLSPQLTNAYYHADGSGNITGLVSTNALLVARYAYDPFGNLVAQWGPLAAANRYRFSSKEFHSLSGLYYYGFRFYEPSLQRWLNRDPIQEADGPNLFAFAHNASINAIDDLGLGVIYIKYADGSTHLEITPTQPKQLTSGEKIRDFVLPNPKETIRQADQAFAAAADPNRRGYERLSAGLAGTAVVILGVVELVPGAGAETKPLKRECTSLIAGAKILDKKTGKILEGNVDLKPTLERIASGKKFPHGTDGGFFENRPLRGKTSPELPSQPPKYYREYVHPTSGIQGPGPQRIVAGKNGELYYTPDHYTTFIKLN